MGDKTYLQLYDMSAQSVDGKIVQISREFVDNLTLFSTAPWKEATHIDKDVQVFEELGKRFDSGLLTNLDKGGSPHKAGYYKRESYLGMFEDWSEFNRKTMELVPNAGVYMERQIRSMHERLGRTIEYALLNISHSNYPDAPDGILPRFNKITDLDGNVLTKDGSKTGESTPWITLDALGAKESATQSHDGALSSILLVYFDPLNGLSLTYPRGSGSIGIQYFAPTDYQTTNKDGKYYEIATAHTRATLGVSIGNSLAVTRIANVDPKDETSLKQAMNCLFDAYARMDSTMKNNVHIYTTLPVVSAIRKMQYKNVYQTSLAGVQALNLKGQVVVDNDIFTVCHNMLSTEGRIKTSDEE